MTKSIAEIKADLLSTLGDETRLAFIAGVNLASKTKSDAIKVFTDMGISDGELFLAAHFSDAVLKTIRDNIKPEPKSRKKRTAKPTVATVIEESANSHENEDDEDSDYDDDTLGVDE